MNIKGTATELLYSNMQNNPCNPKVGTYFFNRAHKNIVFVILFKLKTYVHQKHHLRD